MKTNRTALLYLILFFTSRMVGMAQNTFPASGNVGVGTSSPLSNLHIDPKGTGGILIGTNSSSGGYTALSLQISSAKGGYSSIQSYEQSGSTWGNIILNASGGNVGIGTTSPASALHVIGTISANNSASAVQNGVNINAGNTNVPASTNVNRLRFGGNDANYNYFTIQGPGNIDYLTINNGNIGVGTTDPKGYKLAVNGSVIFTKAVVKNYANWPDYVFDSSYQLPSLESVYSFITTNKHLPEMPSASAIEKDGHDLGEVQKLLLKKMEEMTLYIIEQQKTIEKLSTQNQLLSKDNLELKEKVELIISRLK